MGRMAMEKRKMKYDDGKAYDQSTQGPYYDLWFEMIEHYLNIYLPEKGQLLDAGGGTGEFSIRAASLRKNLSCVNLDISQSMLDHAEQKFKEAELLPRVGNMLGDIQKLPYQKDSFDYVMCLGDAISFCSDVELAFSELVRVTKPGGNIHLSVNSFWGNYHAMYSQSSKPQGISFDDVRKYMTTRVLHINGQSTGCRSFTLEELNTWAKHYKLIIRKRFAAPVFPPPAEWLKDESISAEIRDLQYRHCENESIMEFGNHLNIIYEKGR